MADLIIERADILSPDAERLILALNEELSTRYPEPGANHFRLDADEVRPGRGSFLIARRAGAAVACGALRKLGGHVGEIKRMYVDPAERGRGVGRAMLAALEMEARGLGLRRLVLETGSRQPDALALYERAAFARTGPFGDYAASPLSVFMAKDLPPAQPTGASTTS
jgi:GNAT superfamily N-acetyltransferase